MEKNKIQDNMGTIFLLVAVILILLVGGAAIYDLFRPQDTDTYKFEVTGIVGAENATTLTSLHFECIKYCIDHTSNDYGSRDKCYSACQTLGKESC